MNSTTYNNSSSRTYANPTSKNDIRDLEYLAEFLDSKYKLGGIGIGWDAILGLVPGVGDMVTSSMSFYILFRAAVVGAPPFLVARMCLNILVDSVLNFIPILGNFIDIFWKSNNKNVRLLQNYMRDPHTTTRKAKTSVILSIIVILIFAAVVFTGIAFGMYYLGSWLYDSLQGYSAAPSGGEWDI